MFIAETLLTVATEKVGEALLTGISAQINPEDIETFLKQAIKAANEKYHPHGLFDAFQKDGRLTGGYGPFLNQFFRGRARSELQKPLAGNQGRPDIVLLAKALEKDAAGHSKLKDLETDKIQTWMQVFVETYFRATNRFLQFQIIQEDYCNQIRLVFDEVRFAGIAVEGQNIDQPEQLADIFVMPDVQEDDMGIRKLPEDVPSEVMDNPQQRLLWEQRQQILLSKQRTSERKFSAANLLTEDKTNRAVLLGTPGSGKTTLMNYFAVIATVHNTKKSEHKKFAKGGGSLNLPLSTCLPIIIRIRDLARHPDLSILEFVQEFAEKDLVVTRNLTGFFEYYLENGNALILLDGLDEVADIAQRYKVVDKIEAFLNQFEDCPAIITSRLAGYKRDFFRTDEYPHYELQLFDDEKIDIFIDHWYDSRFALESERERRKTSLRKALKDQTRIKQLARNPLLLTIIALIHRYQDKLPKERYKLYDKAVETLLTTWDSQKKLSNHEVLKYLGLDDLRRLMERLAYWIHCQGGTGDTEGGTLIDRDELISQLTQYIREMKSVKRHQAKKEAKRFLEQIVMDRAGLLSLQGQDRYAFVHKTFQEYLTAMEIRDQQEEGFEVVLEHINQHLHDPHWEEVLLLLIAQQKRKNPVKVLQTILNHDTSYEQWLHRNLLFAGSVLAENVPVADISLTSSIIDGLITLEATQSPLVNQKLRNKTFRIVSGLYDTVFEHTALEQLESYKDKLDRWRFLEYQSALAPKQATVTILALLKDDEADVRSRAANALGNLGTASDAVITGLLALLKDDEADVRSRAAEALGNLGTASDAVITGLLALLKDDEVDVRSLAALALGNLGTTSDTMVTGLLALLKDDRVMVRSLAALALGNLGTTSDAVITGLLALLKDDEADVRSFTAKALENLGDASDAVITGLLALLKDDKVMVRSRAAEALGNLGTTSDAVITGLLALLKDDEADVRSRAANALGNLGDASDAVITGLLALLKDDEAEIRYSAAKALGNLSTASDAVITGLLALLKDDKGMVRSRAAETLGNLGTTSDAVITGLLALLKDDKVMVRSRAAEALGNLGTTSDAVITGLLALLKDDEAEIRSRAAEALGNLGAAPNAVITGLLALLKDDKGMVRSRAAETLGNLSTASDAVITGLLALLKDDKVEVRYSAAEALGNLGTTSDAVITGLFALFKDDVEEEEPDITRIIFRYQATTSLIALGKQSNKIKPALVRWIEQHQDKEFVGHGIDLLWELVS